MHTGGPLRTARFVAAQASFANRGRRRPAALCKVDQHATILTRSRSSRSARSEQTRAVGLRRGEAATSNSRHDLFLGAAACEAHAASRHEQWASAEARLRHRTAGTTLSRSRSLRSARSEQTRVASLRRGEAATSNGRHDLFLGAAACEAHAASGRELRAFAGRSCGPPR